MNRNLFMSNSKQIQQYEVEQLRSFDYALDKIIQMVSSDKN